MQETAGEMAGYEYVAKLGQQKLHNNREVNALLRAIDAKGSSAQSLHLFVDNSNGLEAELELLESPHLSSLERLALTIHWSVGGQSLAIVAKAVEAGKISSLQHLAISYHGDDPHHDRSGGHGVSDKQHYSSSSSSQSFSGSYGSETSAQSSASSSSTGARSHVSRFQSEGSRQAAVSGSWEGFASLAGVLRKNFLPRFEAVCLHGDWSCRRLGDTGVQYLSKLIGTGYLSTLKELNLADCAIENAGLDDLADALGAGNLIGLERLNLSKNSNLPLSGTGIQKVLEAMEEGHLPALNWVGLSGIGSLSPLDVRSIAERVIEIFTRNSALTANVDMDWPNKMLQGRWSVVRERNVRYTRILGKIGRQEEVPVRTGKIFICGFPGVGKTTLRSSLKRSKIGALIGNEHKRRSEKSTRGIEVTKIKGGGSHWRNSTNLSLTLWDLAGQEDFQVLHSSFLPDLGMANGRGTTFMVVFDARYNRLATKSASAEEELVYWMRFIASNSIIGVRRRVLVILNTFNGVQCTEKAQWDKLLRSVRGTYEDVLDINVKPFVLDARLAKSASCLKQELFLYTKSVLRDLRWPKICGYVQENLEQWSRQNRKFPIIRWCDFIGKVAASRLSPEKLEAAIEYLHETGDLIYFRKGSLAEAENPETKLIVLDPQWFCKRIVGQLLLPEGMLDEGETPLKKSVAPDGSLRIREIKAYFEELLTSDPQVDYVLGMLFRLGLCYKAGQDKVLIPALIEEDELPPQTWGRYHSEQYTTHWVMGRSLVLKDSERTALPKAVFRRLQVQLAQDPELGGLANSNYAVGKSFLTFNKRGMSVLVQFDVNDDDPRDDRIDVVSKPLKCAQKGTRIQRNLQMELVEKVMARLQQLCLEWCPGVQFVQKVILPWSASHGALPMLERNAKTSMEEIILWLKSNAPNILKQNYSELNWFVGEEEVEEYELLSTSEIHELLTWAKNRGQQLRQLAVDLDIMPEESLAEIDFEPHQFQSSLSETESRSISEKSRRVRISPSKNPSTFSPLHRKVERESLAIRTLIDQRNLETRRHFDMRLDEVVDKTEEVRDSFLKAFRLQNLLLRKVQDLEQFSIEELESSVPRFMYLTAKERSGIWITMRQAVVAKSSVMHLLCESRYRDGVVHEVEGQKGLEITQLRDWASVVAPWLERTLKVAILAVKLAGGVLVGGDLIPGLDHLIPRFEHQDGATLAAEISLNILSADEPGAQSMDSPPRSDSNIESQISHVNRRTTGRTLPRSATNPALNAKASLILRTLLGQSSEQLASGIHEHFQLRRVILNDLYDGQRPRVVWICGPCCKKYGTLARDIF